MSFAIAVAPTPQTEKKQRAVSLSSLVPSAWKNRLKESLAAASFQQLETFLAAEEVQSAVFPPRDEIFAALKQMPPSGVKVVILGQDPYPTPGQANGFAFSVAKGQKIPASLRNIDAALTLELGFPKPTSGDLTPWAKQGVLLLNTVLTVRKGEPNSHRKRGWEPFTEAILKTVNEERGPIVFLCFGAQARMMADKIVDTTKHTIVATPHPSPLTGKSFLEAIRRDHPFQTVNTLLERSGRGAIDWHR